MIDIKTVVAHIRRRLSTPITISLGWITLKYLLFCFVGLAAFLAGVRTLRLTTFSGYEPIWALAVGVAAFIGFLATLDKRLEWVEGMAAYTIVGFLLVLIASLVARDSYAVAGLCAMVAIIPAVRGGWVAMHIGKLLGRAWDARRRPRP